MDLIEVSQNENRHPWELSRTKCIINELFSLGINGNVLDIGCGDSYFDRKLIEKRKNLKVYGVDINLKTEIQEERLKALNSLDKLPSIKFDYILMMDVIEHIENDSVYLQNLVDKYLSDEGFVLITVPAFMSLYSLHDKELKHFRRYNHKELKKVITSAGLREKKWSYFYFSLILPRIIFKNKTQNLGLWDKKEDSFTTKFVTFVLNTDFKICSLLSKFGIHLPGLSLMSVCQKR